VAALSALAAALGAVATVSGQAPLSAKGVRLPFEYDEEGRIRAEFYAASATLPNAAGDISATDVRIVFSDEAGRPDTTVVCGGSQFRLSEKTARSDDPVRVEKPGILMTGVGYRCVSSDKVILINRDVRVVIDRSLKEQRMPTARSGGGL